VRYDQPSVGAEELFSTTLILPGTTAVSVTVWDVANTKYTPVQMASTKKYIYNN
jgi:hypothetical protein